MAAALNRQAVQGNCEAEHRRAKEKYGKDMPWKSPETFGNAKEKLGLDVRGNGKAKRG